MEQLSMQVNSSIFKAYDIRGLAAGEITEEVAYVIGQALVRFMGVKTVVVGRDMRESSPVFMQALTRGIISQGTEVIDVGLTSTPLFYFAVASRQDRQSAGVMVTASHNPAEYNGFKVCFYDAQPLGAESGMGELRELTVRGPYPAEKKPGRVIRQEVLGAYCDTLLALVSPSSIRPLKIVVDAGNGMAGYVLPALLGRLPCTLIPLYFELDGRFPNHEANPLKAETLTELRAAVVREKADLGIAFDGDADRVGFVDEQGQIVPGDILTALLARELLKVHPGAIVLYDVRESRVVSEEITKAGGQAEMFRVGHAFIKRRMRENGAVFAGELSMHFYFKEFYGVDCGDLAMLYMLKLVSESGQALSQLVSPFLRYVHSGELNFTVADKHGKLRDLRRRYTESTTGEAPLSVSTIDGLRIDFEHWWFNVRSSNTEPFLRLTLEAKNPAMLEEKKQELIQQIEL